MEQASKTFKIVNKLGLHARASALFVKMASKFKSDIFVSKGKKKINGKSIMGLLMLAGSPGSRITIEAIGIDAREALSQLGELVSKGFHED